MRELSNVELDLIVGGYGETGDGFDESAYASQATVLEDGSYSLQVSDAEYSANVAAAEAEEWCLSISVVHHSDGRVDVTVRSADSC
jgi:hypothetical protein